MKTKCKHVKILMTRKTNKVANELNKLGIGKKTKQNITGKKATLPTRDSFQDVKGGEEERAVLRGGGIAVSFIKKQTNKALRNMIIIHIK